MTSKMLATNEHAEAKAEGELVATGLVSGYHQSPILSGIDLRVRRGEVLCVLGANGAGKSTLARTLVGLLPLRQGEIVLDGEAVGHLPVGDRVVRGLSLVPEGRALFPSLRVADNLRLGAFSRNRAQLAAAVDDVLDLFPALRPRLRQLAGTLSGGEQQMLAIGRALVARPNYLVLDEPSLGLAPIIVDRILGKVRELADSAMGIVLIEQNASLALSISDFAVVMERGVKVVEGPAKDIATDDAVVRAYFGGVGRSETATHSPKTRIRESGERNQ